MRRPTERNSRSPACSWCWRRPPRSESPGSARGRRRVAIDVAASRLILPSVLAALAIQAALKFVNGFLLTRVSERILADLRIRVYDHLQALPLQFFQRASEGRYSRPHHPRGPQLSGFITDRGSASSPWGWPWQAWSRRWREPTATGGARRRSDSRIFSGAEVIGRRLRSVSMESRRKRRLPSPSAKRDSDHQEISAANRRSRIATARRFARSCGSA